MSKPDFDEDDWEPGPDGTRHELPADGAKPPALIYATPKRATATAWSTSWVAVPREQHAPRYWSHARTDG